MALTDVGTGSFDFYEGIRILLPGILAAGLVQGVVVAVPLPAKVSLASDPLSAFFLALGMGLLLYFVDIPSKSAAYNNELPTALLSEHYEARQWPAKHVLNDFFVLMDTAMPPQIRARALYMGSMFRIGFESILLIAGFQFGIWSFALIHKPGHLAFQRRWYLAALVIQGGIVLLRLGASMVRSVDSSRGGRVGTSELQGKSPMGRLKSLQVALDKTLREVGKDVGIAGAGILTASISIEACNFRFLRSNIRVSMLVSAILMAFWIVRFIWGRHPFRLRERAPVSSLGSLLLYLAPTLLILSLVAARRGGVPLLGQTYIGWVGVTLIPSLLIASRGHEKRLRGAYVTQRRWLEHYLATR